MHKNIFIEFIIKYPKFVLVGMLTMTLGVISFFPLLQKDPSPHLLPPTHQSRINQDYLRETYTGAENLIFVMLEAEDTIFKPKTLERIQLISESLEEMVIVDETDIALLTQISQVVQGESQELLQELIASEISVDSWEQMDEIVEALTVSEQMLPTYQEILARISKRMSPIIEVNSLATIDNILGVEGGLDINPIYEDIPENAEEVQGIADNVKKNSLFKNALFSEDAQRTGIVVELAIRETDTDSMESIYAKVDQILSEIHPGDEKYYVGGLPVSTSVLRKTIDKDTSSLFPIVMIIVSICLWLTFHMWQGVMVPMTVVGLAVLATLSLMAILGFRIGSVTSTLPVFLISVGVADGIHIFSEYRNALLAGKSKETAVRETITHLTLPVFLTSITTGVGFWALSFTEITQIKQFGWFVALGTILAMIYSLVFIPALLMLLPENKKKVAKRSRIDDGLELVLRKMMNWTIQHTKTIALVSAGIMGLGVYGLSQVKVDSNIVKYFPADSPVVISTNALDQRFSGSLTLNILIEGEERDAFKQPENLLALDQLEQFIYDQELVGRTVSLASLLRRINVALHEEDQTYNQIPSLNKDKGEGVSGNEAIAQYLLLYENGGGDVLSDVINSEYNRANLSITLKTNSSHDIQQLVAKIERYAAQNLPTNLKIEFGGSGAISLATGTEVVDGQISSFSLSIGLVFLMLCFIFRSMIFGLLGIIPMLFTISVNFGIMGFAGIRLDVGTAIVSSIVIGIGVDFSIHFLSRFREAKRQGKDFEGALDYTMNNSGKAIISNALTVSLGFLTLLAAEFVPVTQMGWMISLTLMISAISTLLLIPILQLMLMRMKVITSGGNVVTSS